MNLKDWIKSNEYSHYQSLIKQDIENKKKIKQLMIENTELKRKQANDVDTGQDECHIQRVPNWRLSRTSIK